MWILSRTYSKNNLWGRAPPPHKQHLAAGAANNTSHFDIKVVPGKEFWCLFSNAKHSHAISLFIKDCDFHCTKFIFNNPPWIEPFFNLRLFVIHVSWHSLSTNKWTRLVIKFKKKSPLRLSKWQKFIAVPLTFTTRTSIIRSGRTSFFFFGEYLSVQK